MKRKAVGYLLGLLILSSITATAEGQRRFKIKMATLAPKGSPWHTVLVEMGQKWERATNGKIQLKIYPDGVAGDEDSMIRKMRIGQFQAAALSFNGIAFIDKSVNAFAIPLLYDDFEHLDRVRELLDATIRKRLEEKGFVLLAWADVGWVRLFGKKPIIYPDDLKAQKMFTWAGDEVVLKMWKNAGFRAVPLQPVDILTGLQTGLIEAFASPPFGALASQWFSIANNMTDLKFSPFSGGFVIDKRTWDKIPEDYRIDMMVAADELSEKVKSKLRYGDADFIQAMVEHGLTVQPIDEATLNVWRETAKSFYPVIRGEFVPEDMFDRVLAITDSCRIELTESATNP